MNRLVKFLGWSTLLVLMAAAVLLAAALAALGANDDAVIRVNGAPFAAADLGAANWLAAIGGTAVGLAVACIVLVVVVPLAVLLPLLLVGLLLGGVLLALAGVAAVACSPVIVLAGMCWLVWRLARGPRGSPPQARPSRDSNARIVG